MKIKQVWVPYSEWEDFKNGMWRKVARSEEPALLQTAIEFTGDWNAYGAAMQKVVFAWPKTMLNTLTNPAINQKAFVGLCACCYHLALPEYLVRRAWGILTEVQRVEANHKAQQAIEAWRIWHYNKRQLKIQFPEND